MIAKSVLLLCMAAAVFSSDLDSLLEEIYGTTAEPILTTVPQETYETCTTKVGEEGKCVPYYSCRKEVDTTSLKLNDIHFPEEACGFYLDVCCTAANRVLPSTEPGTATTEAPQ